MHEQVGDLCFTSDGIAKKGLLVRHLVMPGKEREGQQIMQWMGSDLSRDTFVNIMEQYHPDAHVGKMRRASRSSERSPLNVIEPGGERSIETMLESRRYEDINRSITATEISSIRKAAEHAGLWRFVEHARHEGFNL